MKILGRVLAAIGKLILGFAALMMVANTYQYISEYHSCADFGHLEASTAAMYGIVLSVPGLALLILGRYLHGVLTSQYVIRFVAGIPAIAAVSYAVGVLSPKPGKPCGVVRGLPPATHSLAMMQESFFADSQRYATSTAELDSTRLAESPDVRVVIVWGDRKEWGGYVEFTKYTGYLRDTTWVCGITSEESPAPHTVPGIGLIRNGCWDRRKPDRVLPLHGTER